MEVAEANHGWEICLLKFIIIRVGCSRVPVTIRGHLLNSPILGTLVQAKSHIIPMIIFLEFPRSLQMEISEH